MFGVPVLSFDGSVRCASCSDSGVVFYVSEVGSCLFRQVVLRIPCLSSDGSMHVANCRNSGGLCFTLVSNNVV